MDEFSKRLDAVDGALKLQQQRLESEQRLLGLETLRERYFYAVCGGNAREINRLAREIKAIKDGTK